MEKEKSVRVRMKFGCSKNVVAKVCGWYKREGEMTTINNSQPALV